MTSCKVSWREIWGRAKGSSIYKMSCAPFVSLDSSNFTRRDRANNELEEFLL